jgi:hypothetical protein
MEIKKLFRVLVASGAALSAVACGTDRSDPHGQGNDPLTGDSGSPASPDSGTPGVDAGGNAPGADSGTPAQPDSGTTTRDAGGGPQFW